MIRNIKKKLYEGKTLTGRIRMASLYLHVANERNINPQVRSSYILFE